MNIYGELVKFDGEWFINTSKDRICIGEMISYLSALDKASENGWLLVDVVILPTQSKYILTKII